MNGFVVAAGFMLLTLSAARSAEPLPASTLVFKNVLATRSGDHTAYAIVGTGMFLAPRADNLDAFIASWLKRHPEATAMVVDQSTMGKKPGHLDYVWIEDGSDNLNVDLVRQGIVPGGTMADGVEYLDSIRAVAHVDPNSPDFPKRLVTDEAYRAFINRIMAAETEARADKVGLWSDKYRAIMEEDGYVSH